MATIRADFISGQVQENPLSSVATTLTMSGRLQDLPSVGGGDVAYLTIDPEGVDVLAGSGTEVVAVTAYTHAAGTATIARHQRGTTARPHSQGVKITLSWMKEDIDELAATTGAETTRAEAAESTLQSNINSEASTRAGADSSEAATRAGADTTLQNNINSEASTRASADSTLQSNIDAEAATRAGADTTLQNNINSEASTRASADSSEASTRASADSSEASTRASADSSEASTRASADSSEASTRATNDNKRLKLIGATGHIGGTDPAVDGSVELLAQFGKGDITSDGVGGGFTFGFPVSFPNACIGAFLQNCSATTAQQALIPIPISATTNSCTGDLLASDSGSPALLSTITIEWVAYGW